LGTSEAGTPARGDAEEPSTARTVAGLNIGSSGSPRRRTQSRALIATGARKPRAISQNSTPEISHPAELPSSRGGSRPRSMKFQPSAMKSAPTIAGQPIDGPSAQCVTAAWIPVNRSIATTPPNSSPICPDEHWFWITYGPPLAQAPPLSTIRSRIPR
jgi:hypothetical protein